MASSIASSTSSSATAYSHHRKPISQNLILSSFSISFPRQKSRQRFPPIKAVSDGGGSVRSSQDRRLDLLRKPVAPSPSPRDDDEDYSDGGGAVRSSQERGFDLLRKPVALSPSARYAEEEEDDESAGEYSDDEGSENKGEGGDGDTYVNWEDRILEDTVPLVGFIRMILHSGKYGSGERLSPEHERTILERVLPYHPAYESKIGCGVDYITIGYHPNFGSSRCLFIVRKDGEWVDFSYWKCIKGLIRKNYPLYADNFILWHFRGPKRHSD